jgi:hypothetical protein
MSEDSTRRRTPNSHALTGIHEKNSPRIILEIGLFLIDSESMKIRGIDRSDVDA